MSFEIYEMKEAEDGMEIFVYVIIKGESEHVPEITRPCVSLAG